MKAIAGVKEGNCSSLRGNESYLKLKSMSIDCVHYELLLAFMLNCKIIEDTNEMNSQVRNNTGGRKYNSTALLNTKNYLTLLNSIRLFFLLFSSESFGAIGAFSP